jgi:hypothetical protein
VRTRPVRCRPPDGAASARAAASAGALALLVAALASPPDLEALSHSAAAFTRHFVIGGFAAAVGCAPAARPLPVPRATTALALLSVRHSLTQPPLLCHVSTAAVYPLDLVKTRMQVEPSRWASAATCFSDTLADSGVPGLYAGMGAQMVGVAPEKSFKARRTRRTRVCKRDARAMLCDAMRLALCCADAAARA